MNKFLNLMCQLIYFSLLVGVNSCVKKDVKIITIIADNQFLPSDLKKVLDADLGHIKLYIIDTLHNPDMSKYDSINNDSYKIYYYKIVKQQFPDSILTVLKNDITNVKYNKGKYDIMLGGNNYKSDIIIWNTKFSSLNKQSNKNIYDLTKGMPLDTAINRIYDNEITQERKDKE